MIQDLRIVHRLKPAVFAASSHFPVWATCLRSLAFTNATNAAADLMSGDELYSGENAYRFLLEVVCGLKSPIVGETEVLGQFKQFSQEWLKLEPGRATLVQRLFSDAKAIRTEYLTGLGVQSYGSWVRSRLEPKRAHFLGAGQLVREIYPYLEKQGRELAVHVRDQARLEWNAPARHLSERAFDHGALIVAAPMGAAEIQAWLGERVPEQIVDLRDNSDTDRLTFARQTKIFVLRDIFAQIESTKAKLLPRLEQVDGEIRARAAKLASQSQVRPQGWDDLCA